MQTRLLPLFPGTMIQEITGKNLTFFIDTSDHEAFRTFTHEVKKESSLPHQGEFRFATKSGDHAGSDSLHHADNLFR